MSPEYALFRERMTDDALTRKLSVPIKHGPKGSEKLELKSESSQDIVSKASVPLRSNPSDTKLKRMRAVSETFSHRASLNDLAVEITGTQTQRDPLSEKTICVNRVQSSPALLSEVVKRLPLSLKTDSDIASQSFSDFLKQVACESLAIAPLSKLSSPIFKMTDQIDSPLSDVGGATPPQLFQISPHSWSELAGLAVARERKISLSKRSVSRTPSDGSERQKSDQTTDAKVKTVPHVITCQGSKVTIGFCENSKDKEDSEKITSGTSGIDTHIGTVFLQPPDLPEETLMPNEHLRVMEILESKSDYADCIINIAEQTETLWTETYDLFIRNTTEEKQKGLEVLLPTEEVRAIKEMALLSEAVQILMKIIEFAQRQNLAGNLLPTKAMKSGELLFLFSSGRAAGIIR